MDERLAYWFDITSDLLAEPMTRLPHAMLMKELVGSLNAKAGSWIHRRADGHVDDHMVTGSVKLDDDAIEWMRGRLDQHPLLCWFAATADPTAQTVSQVPRTLWDPRYAAWDCVQGLDVQHQMSIPVALSGRSHRAFVLVAHDSDFTVEDLQLARRLQGLLIGLDRQARALARWLPCAPSNDGGLTPRELAVLGLVADGLTARAIANKLLISPRTVQKHLENIYVKLRTTDKVSAVLRAQALGLLGASHVHSRSGSGAGDQLGSTLTVS